MLASSFVDGSVGWSVMVVANPKHISIVWLLPCSLIEQLAWLYTLYCFCNEAQMYSFG